MRLLELFAQLLGRAMLSVMAGDILYLYYAGGWVEPIKLVLYLELVLLYFTVLAGIVWTIYHALNWR